MPPSPLNPLGDSFRDSATRAPKVPETSFCLSKGQLIRTLRIPVATLFGLWVLVADSLSATPPELPEHLHEHREAVLSILAQPRPHLEAGVPTEAEALTAWEGEKFPPGHPALAVASGDYGILRVDQAGKNSFMAVQLDPEGHVLHAFPAGTTLERARGLLKTALMDDNSDNPLALAAK